MHRHLIVPLCSTSQLVSMTRNHTPRTAIEEGDQQNGAHFLHKKSFSCHGTIQQGHLYMKLVYYLLHDRLLIYPQDGGAIEHLHSIVVGVMDTVLELHSAFGFGKFLKAREFKEQAEDIYYRVKELCGCEVDDDDTIIHETAWAARAAAGTTDANGNLVSCPNTAARANSDGELSSVTSIDVFGPPSTDDSESDLLDLINSCPLKY